MHRFSLDCAYCAAKLIDETNQQWLGDIFDWQECAKQNYIDINCFTTKSSNRCIQFDEKLQRFVDWDYILTLTKEVATSYLSCSLVNYCNKHNSNRITTTVYQNGEHIAQIKSIKDKHLQCIEYKNNKDARIRENL